jgi:hypothetical protein
LREMALILLHRRNAKAVRERLVERMLVPIPEIDFVQEITPSPP